MKSRPLKLSWVLIIILGFVVALAMGIFALQNTAGQKIDLDEYPINYVAAKNWLLHNRSPYDPANGIDVSKLSSGKDENLAGKNVRYFRYPLLTTVLVIPTTLMTMVVGKSLWMVINILCLVISGILMIVAQKQKFKITALVGLALFSGLNYFSVQSLLTGSLVPMFLLIITIVLVLLVRHDDIWAGIIGTFALIVFQYGVLVLVFFNWWAIRTNRKHFLRSFWTAFIFELAISMILSPTWLAGWLNAIIKDITDAGYYSSLLSQLVRVNFPDGMWLNLILHLVLLLIVLTSTTAYKYQDDQELIWMVALIMVTTSLVAFPVLPGCQILCLPALIMVTGTWITRLKKGGEGFYWTVIAIMFTIPWLSTILGGTDLTTYLRGLLFAMTGLIGLRWIRWWMMQPKY